MEKYLIHDFTDMGFAREPVIRRLKSGVLVCAFLTGGDGEPRLGNVVMLSKSLDDGKTWTKPETVASHSARGCWATEIFTETERPFIVVHTYNTNDWKKEHYRELATFRLFLDGAGDPVGEPVSLPGLGGVSVRQGIVMSNGEWLFPCYFQEVVRDFDWNAPPKEGEGDRYPFRCTAAVTKDGSQFARYGYLAAPFSLWEPNCVEVEAGHILMLMRSNGEAYLRRADSYDYGRTWTEPVLTDIPNGHTKPTLFRIGEDLFLANNFAPTTGMKNRRSLQIRTSKDGNTWKFVCAPEEDGANVFYPHAALSDETQTLYLAYEDGVRHYLAKYAYGELLSEK